MYSGFLSINSVIDRVMRHPLCNDLLYESAVVWAVDVIKHIGSPAFLQGKIVRLTIENNRCIKPCDMVFVRQARRVSNPLSETSQWDFTGSAIPVVDMEDDDYVAPEEIYTYSPNNTNEGYEAMYEATDSFHEFYNRSDMANTTPENTYKFNGNYVYTSFASGIMDVAYDGLLLDDDGIPMVPNDVAVEKAIENNIKREYFGILQDLGKDVVRAYQRANEDYLWYIGAAQGHAAFNSIDKREAMSNTYRRLILNDNHHGQFFRHSGHPERIRKQ
jgi:hypothetical protein